MTARREISLRAVDENDAAVYYSEIGLRPEEHDEKSPSSEVGFFLFFFFFCRFSKLSNRHPRWAKAEIRQIAAVRVRF